MTLPIVLTLTEYASTRFDAATLTLAEGEALARRFGKHVQVEPPSFRTDGQWQLTSLGWVGYIPFSPTIHFHLQPRIPIRNIFSMLAAAYDLDSLQLLPGMARFATLPEVCEQLAVLLARRTLERCRLGLARDYVQVSARLPYVRGRIDPRAMLANPAAASIPCRFDDFTADTVANQILAWALYVVQRSGWCSAAALQEVGRASRCLAETVTLRPHPPSACLGRAYRRDDADYRLLHALCWFFLAHSGPTHQPGDAATVPLLVDMARLYERFVARWLAAHLPATVQLRAQESVRLGTSDLHFKIDLVLTDSATGVPLAVLDTKYKPLNRKTAQPDGQDIAQVIAYAATRRCHEAGLIYPLRPAQPQPITLEAITVRTLGFALDGDLDAGGAALLRDLAPMLQTPRPETVT